MASQHPSEKPPYNEEFLCDDCRTVDWSSLPTLAADGFLEAKNLELRPLNATVDELKNSSCRVCVILSSIIPNVYHGPLGLKALPLSRQISYDARHLSHASRFKLHALDTSRCTVLSISNKPRGILHKMQACFGRSLVVLKLDDLEARKVAQSSIDYNRLKDLMSICEKEHKRCCAVESSPNVLGLEVIDTKTQEVIKAPEQCEYLALSYVWGKEASHSSDHSIRNSPAVIKDAISVTNSMGYEYLWVDRYCISDPKDKSRMISQMDQIYANASITIIAAADGDTDMGLSGVSMHREPQRWVDIQGVSLLELPVGHQDLKSSKWASRGWTFQEGYLSRRRLIFTKTQVLFLCNEMYAAESLQQLFGANCFSDKSIKFENITPRGGDADTSYLVQDLLHNIAEYNKRELTRSSDSLNAILGVFSYYEKRSADSQEPLLRLPWGLIATKHAGENAFTLHFGWYHDKPATRRTDFPSWSWTGWGGPIRLAGTKIELRPKHTFEEDDLSYLDWRLSMRDVDGRIVSMYDLAWKELEAQKFQPRLYQPFSKQLLISCLVIPVSFREFNLTEDQKKQRTEISISDTNELVPSGRDLADGALPTLQVWEGIYAGLERADMNLDQQMEQQDCILALLKAHSLDPTIYSCLLARQLGEGLYERIGDLMMDALDLNPKTSGVRYPGIPYEGSCQAVYMDENDCILDNFTISNMQRRHPFADTAERRTICLV